MKFHWILLLLLILSSCNLPSSSVTSKETIPTNEPVIPSATEPIIDLEVEEVNEDFSSLEFGQKFDVEDVDIQIETAQWGDSILPRNTTGSFLSTEGDEEGYKYYYLWGTIENNRGNYINPSAFLKISFIFNDNYTYDGTVHCESVDGTRLINTENTIYPLEKKRFIIFVSVPDKIEEIFEYCDIRIGYDDDLNSDVFLREFKELDHHYQLKIRQ